jgi:hypothetical protein
MVTHPDPWDLVCGNSNAHTRPADDDRPVCFPLGDLFSSCNSDMWIGRLVGPCVYSDIDDLLDSWVFFQFGLDGLFIVESSFISSDRYCPGWG